MLGLLYHQYPMLVGIAAGLLMIFWPPPKWPAKEKLRRARIAELEAGANEAYFEERRALEAYGPRSGGPFRFWGFLLLALSLVPLVAGWL
jgi:hypothetical protein